MHVGTTVVRRRTLLKGAALGTALAFSPAFYRHALAAPTTEGPGPYGALQDPDANGVMLPEGFTSRIVAVSGEPVLTSGDVPTSYLWHTFPDGSACFPTEDGGWRYVCNSEVPGGLGGAGGIQFDADGNIVDAYSVLTGTSTNCAGGPTPWGTWLSCEENGDDGQVYECDPDGATTQVLPALGSFNHEAVAVDPDNEVLYLTEDTGDGCFYRFLPTSYPDLTAGGQLQAAQLDGDGFVTWLDVSPESAPTPVRLQQPDATRFDGGEGIWFDQLAPGKPGFVYFTTKGTNQVWVLDIAMNRIAVLYDAADFDEPVLTGVDNVTIAPSGDVLVAEDGGNLEIVLISADTREVAPIMRLTGDEHLGSEITGPSFSPDGTRLFFSSQRGRRPGIAPLDISELFGPAEQLPGSGLGITYEITGPFRSERVGIAAQGVLDAPTGDAGDPAQGALPAAGAGGTLAETGGGTMLAGGAALAAAAALRRRQPAEDDAPRGPEAGCPSRPHGGGDA